MVRSNLLIYFFTFMIAGAALSDNTGTYTDQKWLNHAKEIERSLDESQNPCNDFFEFACGGWKKNHPIPPGKQNLNQESLNQEEVKDEIMRILESPPSPNDNLAYSSLKTIYRNCMNDEQRMEVDLKHLLKLINEIGDWPIATLPGTKQNITHGVINNILAPAKHLLGVSALFEVIVEASPWMGPNYNLLLQRSKTPLDHILLKYDRDSEELELYKNNINEILCLVGKAKGLDPSKTHYMEDVNNMIDFQKNLTEIWRISKSSRKKSKTIEEFQSWYDDLSPKQNAHASWIDFFKVILSPVQILDGQEIVIENLNYVGKLVELLDNTPIRIINNFVIWNIFYEFLEYLPQDMENIRRAMDNIGRQTPIVPTERKYRCMQDLPFQHAFMAEYVKKHFTNATKQSTNDIVGKLSEGAKDFINQTRWLTKSQKKVILDEIEKIEWHIGYPSWYDEVSAIDKFYENPRHENGNYIDNRLQINRFEDRTMFSRLNKKHNGTQGFPDKATDISAKFRIDSTITLTAALLLQPLFKPTYPMAIKYGGLGTIIAHEISHLVDSLHVQFNEEISKSWPKATQDEFISRVTCFQEQYDNYVVYTSANSTIKGDGEKSLDENIADNLGIKIAFSVYEKKKKAIDANARLPNLVKYNDRQLFFLSFANKLCSAETLQYYENTQRHPMFVYSFNKLRVNGVVSNMKEFSDAFSCPIKSTMNPTNKCALYGPDTYVSP